MTRRYETVYILDSALEEPAINEKLERLHGLLARDGETPTVTVNHWGKRTLAYPIRSRDTGYYVIAQFEVASDALPEYERAVKLDESVLRFLVVVAETEPPRPVAATTEGSGGAEAEDDDA